ncbi:6821_t:CDS:2, partial [Racocetra fulgida]
RHKLAQPWSAKDKVVLITGASSGIGRSLAHLFAKQEDALINVANECRDQYGATKVVTIKCDVSDENDVSKLIKTVEDSFNKLDCLILNAGVSMGERFESISDYKMIKTIMDINYFGSTYITYKALNLLKNSKGGRIVVDAVKTEINDNRLGKSPSKLDMTSAMSSDECANIIYKGVVRGDKEILFVARGKFARMMEGVFPDAWSYLTRKYSWKAVASNS